MLLVTTARPSRWNHALLDDAWCDQEVRWPLASLLLMIRFPFCRTLPTSRRTVSPIGSSRRASTL